MDHFDLGACHCERGVDRSKRERKPIAGDIADFKTLDHKEQCGDLALGSQRQALEAIARVNAPLILESAAQIRAIPKQHACVVGADDFSAGAHAAAIALLRRYDF
jgi:hypothetical protein